MLASDCPLPLPHQPSHCSLARRPRQPQTSLAVPGLFPRGCSPSDSRVPSVGHSSEAAHPPQSTGNRAMPPSTPSLDPSTSSALPTTWPLLWPPQPAFCCSNNPIFPALSCLCIQGPSSGFAQRVAWLSRPCHQVSTHLPSTLSFTPDPCACLVCSSTHPGRLVSET